MVPLKDCFAALRWLADDEGVDGGRIAIGWASGGGGLAAALALLARRQGEVDVLPALGKERNVRLRNNSSNHIGWESTTRPRRTSLRPCSLMCSTRSLPISNGP